MRRILKKNPKILERWQRRLASETDPEPTFFKAISELPPKYHQGQPTMKELKMNFQTDPLLRSYLSSDLSKSQGGKDMIVDARSDSGPDMSVAVRFAEAWKKVNNGQGTPDDVLSQVEEELEKEYDRVRKNAEKAVKGEMRSVMFDNKAYENEDDVEGEFDLWGRRMESTPYWKWVGGAKASLDKFIAFKLLDFEVWQYADMISRRGGVKNWDDRRLEELVKGVRVAIWGGEPERRDSGMSNKEVGEVIFKFRGMIEMTGGWEMLEESEREEFRNFTRGVLFGGRVPRVKGVKEEDVVMTAIRDVLGMEHVEVTVNEEEEDDFVEEKEYEPTLEERIEDQDVDGYSFFHKVNLMDDEDIKELKRGEEGFDIEPGEMELLYAEQKKYIENYERGRQIEAMCSHWENGVWEVCGKVKKAGMENVTEEEREDAFLYDDSGIEAKFGESFDRLTLGHKEIDVTDLPDGWTGADYPRGQDFDDILEQPDEEEEGGEDISLIGALDTEDVITRVDKDGNEEIVEYRDWYDPTEINAGWKVEWRITRELREKGINWREFLRKIDEKDSGEVNEQVLKEKLDEVGVTVSNEEMLELQKWFNSQE